MALPYDCIEVGGGKNCSHQRKKTTSSPFGPSNNYRELLCMLSHVKKYSFFHRIYAFLSFIASALNQKRITVFLVIGSLFLGKIWVTLHVWIGWAKTRAHRTSKLYSQIDCAASVGQCKTLSNLKSRCYICKEHPHWAEKMVDFEIWICRPWLWLVDSNFWIMIFEGLQELSKFLFDFLLLHKFLNT